MRACIGGHLKQSVVDGVVCVGISCVRSSRAGILCIGMRRQLATVVFALLSVSAFGTRADAQSEGTLRAALEGRMVSVKIDMPGTAKGVDVFPMESAPVDWREVARRIKDNGTALRIGQISTITKVVLKNDHVEVQLGGGGYGTFGDNTGNAVSYSDQGETVRERQLRDSIKTSSGDRRKRMQTELDNARSRRERDNDRNRALAAQANEARDANVRMKRAEGGSRFNIWYRKGMPDAAITPDGVMNTLSQYIAYAETNIATGVSNGRPSAPATGGAPYNVNPMLTIRKGLSVPDVEALFGPANTASERKEGMLTVVTRNYVYDGKKIVASFVNGVLIDYVIAPQ